MINFAQKKKEMVYIFTKEWERGVKCNFVKNKLNFEVIYHFLLKNLFLKLVLAMKGI